MNNGRKMMKQGFVRLGLLVVAGFSWLDGKVQAQTVIGSNTVWNTRQPVLSVSTTFQINDGVILTGSGVSYGGSGALVYNPAALTFIGGSSSALNFQNNTANGDGGVLYSGSNITVDGSCSSILIAANSSGSNGGAFSTAGSIRIAVAASGSLAISDNISDAGHGGALFANSGSIVINGSYGSILINSNTVASGTRYGGAFYAGKDVAITATSASLQINNNSSGTAGYGGALNAGGLVSIGGSYGSIAISGNNSGNGGALRGQGGISINTQTGGIMTVANNRANVVGGALYSMGNVAIGGSYGGLTIVSNSAANSGGAINSGSDIMMSGSYGSLLINSNTSGNQGGAYYAENAISISATAGQLSIANNYAVSNGGAFAAKNGAVSLTGSYGGVSIVSNTSKAYGGAFFDANTGVTINAQSSGDLRITDNWANSGGGAIATNLTGGGQAVTIGGSYANIIINSNTANQYFGGAIAAYNASGAQHITISATTSGSLSISNNMVVNAGGFGGGGIFTQSGNVTVNGSYDRMVFDNNRVGNGSGGVIASWSGDVVIEADAKNGLSLSNNVISNAGGAIDSGRNVAISGSYDNISIAGNQAGQWGGAITAGGTLSINTQTLGDLLISSNTAGAVGGAFNGGRAIVISGSYGNNIKIDSNRSGDTGGAFNSGNNIAISATVGGTLAVSNNRSPGNGGALYSGSDLSVSGSYGNMLIDSNTATAGNGGAFYSGSNISISTTVGGTLAITRNTALNSGGAMYATGNITISGEMSNFLIASNTVASGYGGAFYAAGNVTIDTRTSGTFVIADNASYSGGGAIACAGIFTISGSYGDILMKNNQGAMSDGTHGGTIDAISGINISATVANTLAFVGNKTLFVNNSGIGGGSALFTFGQLNVTGNYGSILIDSNTNAITYNAMDRGGGAFASSGNMTIAPAVIAGDLRITNNYSGANGGALYIRNTGAAISISPGQVDNIIITGNYAGDTVGSHLTAWDGGAGGAIASWGGAVTINTLASGALLIQDNHSISGGAGGGAIFAGAGLTISGTYAEIKIDGNSAYSDGGALEGFPVILNSAVGGTLSLTNNSAGRGGAIWANSVQLSGTSQAFLLVSNTAVGSDGGVIFATQSILVDAHTGTMAIANNTTANNGGAFYAQGGGITLNLANIGNLSINNNTATAGKGGAFYSGSGFYLGTATGTSQFTNNKASSDANGGFLWINSGTAEFSIANGGLLKLGNADSIVGATDSIGGNANSNVLQSNDGTIIYYADNSAYQGDFNLNRGIAQVSNTLNLLGGKLNGSGTLALDQVNAANGGNDFQFSNAQATGNFNGVISLQNSSTFSTSNITTGGPTETILQRSTLRLSGTGVTADLADANGGMGVLVVDQDRRSIGNLDLAGGQLVVWGKSATTAESNILNVKTLQSTAAGSSVAVDAAVLAGINSGTQWVGPIFDLTGTLSRQIVNATVGVDAALDTGRFALVDAASGSSLADISNYSFKNASGSNDVGVIHVGYVAELRDDGLWIGTGVTEIESTNSGELVMLDSNQSLTPGDQIMNAKLSGDGAGFSFEGGNRITLLYLSGNSYTGTSAISGSTVVIAGADSSLGNTRFLSIEDGSQFDLNGKLQTIGGGLAQGIDALTGAGTLTVISGTLEVTDANNGFTANVNIGNSGGAGYVLLDNLSGVGNSGTISFGNNASVLTLNASGTLGKQLNGNGKTLLLENESVYTAGNNSGFSGTFALQEGSILRAKQAMNLGTASILAVSANDPTLSLEGYVGAMNNPMVGNITLLVNDDPDSGDHSDVTISVANLAFSGSAVVDIDNHLAIRNEQALNNRPITDDGLVTLDYTGDWNSVISGSGNVQTLQDITVSVAQGYSGTTMIDAGTLKANVTDAVATAAMDIKNGATFNLNNLNQTVQGLLNNGTVDFGDHGVDSFRTLTVNGDLGGNGTFKMNVAIGTDITPLYAGDLNGAGDLVIVSGTTGDSHRIVLKRQGGNNTVDGRGMQILLIQSGSGGGSFDGSTDNIHQYSGSMDIGMRSAGVQRGDLNGEHNDNWYLVISATSGGGDGGGDTGTGGDVVLDTADLRYIAWFDQDTLVKRMGELRLNQGIFSDLKDHDWEVWVRSYGSQYNLSSNGANRGNFSAMIYGVDIGADKAWNIDKRNVLFTGLFGGYGRADLDVKGDSISGGNDGYSAGFYGTWLHDTGWYADLVGKATYFDSDFKARDMSGNSTNGAYGSWAAGISLEAGRQFQFKDGWYVEPQVQASYAHFFGANYNTTGDNQFAVDLGDADVLQLRFGPVFGRTIKLSEDEKDRGFLQPYVKIFGMEQVSDGGRVTATDGQWRPNTDGMSAIIGCGLIYQIDEANQLHLDYEAQFADKYDKPFGINFGYRHQF